METGALIILAFFFLLSLSRSLSFRLPLPEGKGFRKSTMVDVVVGSGDEK
jgi:hypothetical protein